MPAKKSKVKTKQIVIEKIEIVVKDLKYYDDKLYEDLLIQKYRNKVQVQALTLDNLPIFDTIEIDGIDEKGNKIKYKTMQPRLQEKTIEVKKRLQNVIINITNIAIVDSDVNKYFQTNSKIKHKGFEFDVYEFEEATLQASNILQTETVDKVTLKVFLK
jgi:hypothetical protein